jgi:integrase/recombinase XerC
MPTSPAVTRAQFLQVIFYLLPASLLFEASSSNRSSKCGHHGVFEEGGTLEKAASVANHASTRTTQLYDRRSDEVTLDEVERVGI